MPTPPSNITTLSYPARGTPKAVFVPQANQFVEDLVTLFTPEINTLASVTYDNATEAEQFQLTASAAAVAAANSATQAANSATQAATDVASIGSSVTLAEQWATSTVEVSGGFKGAYGYALDAQTSYDNIIPLESSVQTSAANVAASEIKAQEWAENPEDVEVETGQYSAKHWATKAYGIVNNGLIDDSSTSTTTTWSSSKISNEIASTTIERADFTVSMVANQEIVETLIDSTKNLVVCASIETPQIGVTNNKWSASAAGLDGELEFYDDYVGLPLSISEASYDGVSFSVSGQDPYPAGLAFSNDGLKMFVFGEDARSVYQYSLTSPFDLSTTSYDGVSFSVSGQDPSPTGLAFRNDGLKMFVLGNSNDSVYQYSLTSPFDLSTTSYDGVSFSVSGQEGVPKGLAFSNDGLKMFVSGKLSASVYQYSLTSPFDLSTTSYDGVSFSVSGQEALISAIAFRNDGLKMFVLGNSNDSVYQYSLTSPFDLSTTSYDGVSFSVSGQDPSPTGLAFSNDGLKMFVLGYSNDSVYQYSIGVISNSYLTSLTNNGSQINTDFWTDINSMTANENLNSQNAYYALSTDGRTTWSIVISTNGVRNIVRNNAGTWQYNSNATYGSETWTNATVNTEIDAINQSMTISSNKMTGGDLAAVPDANHITLASSLDLSITMYSSSSSASPHFSGMFINYDANTSDVGAVLGVDYEWQTYSDTSISFKALRDGNFKVRIL